jgi:hypothetical protein
LKYPGSSYVGKHPLRNPGVSGKGLGDLQPTYIALQNKKEIEFHP